MLGKKRKINGGVNGFSSIGVNAGPLEEDNGTVINQNVPIQLIGNSFALNVETIESQLLMV